MKIKVNDKENDLIKIALEIGDKIHYRKHSFDYAYLVFNGLFEIIEVEMNYSDAIDEFILKIPFKDISDLFSCSNCSNCDLYENQTTSNRYFCKITENFISDKEQELCVNYSQL